jgi:exonuclease III
MPTKKNNRCPKEANLLCGPNTLARGLCVQTRKNCKTRTLDKRHIPATSPNNTGKNYGYEEENLGRGCYTQIENLKLNYEKTYEDYDDIPDTFNCITYNIWGLDKPKLRPLFSMRKGLLVKTLTDVNADIMCLQEMSEFSYEELKDFIGKYKFASEVPLTNTSKMRNRAIEVYYISRYTPSRIAIYSLPGVLNYTNSLMVVEYKKLVIFNLYNQAGSKYSIGQEEKGLHYARCRYDLINIIYDMIKTKYKGYSVLVCGDFNFHLDGTKEEWPESAILNKFSRDGFIDTYRDLNRDLGLTENTDLNMMRYNQKLVHKKFRFDAILYKSVRGWRCTKSEVFGQELEYLNEKNSEWFFNYISEANHKGIGIDGLKGVKKRGKKYKLPINASDHFGVVNKFMK